MTDTRVPVSICAACGAPNDGAASYPKDAVPKDGDVSLCMYCGHLAMFASDLSLREVTSEELAVICKDEEIMHLLRLRQKYLGDVGRYTRRKS
jgi:hypothetical protein